jgi:predicted transcriptional regulator
MPRRNGVGIALLADSTRRQIVALLALRTRRPSELARELGLSRPAVSRQLRMLEEADLVVAHRSSSDGRERAYTINHWRHGSITAWLAGTEIGRSSGHDDDIAGPPNRDR